MTYKVAITAAGAEPVTIGQVRAHVRVDDNTHDAKLLDYIAAAREWIQGYAGLLLQPCTLTYTFDALVSPIPLPHSPIRSITSITYVDGDEVSTVLDPAAYVLQERISQAQVVSATGTTFPGIATGSEVVLVAAGGYASPNDIPFSLRTVLYRMVAHQYDNAGLEGGLEGFGPQLFNNRVRWSF